MALPVVDALAPAATLAQHDDGAAASSIAGGKALRMLRLAQLLTIDPCYGVGALDSARGASSAAGGPGQRSAALAKASRG